MLYGAAVAQVMCLSLIFLRTSCPCKHSTFSLTPFISQAGLSFGNETCNTVISIFHSSRVECEWTSHRIGQETDTKETEQVHPQNDIIHLLYNAEYSRHKCVYVRGREEEGGRKRQKKRGERREESSR